MVFPRPPHIEFRPIPIVYVLAESPVSGTPLYTEYTTTVGIFPGKNTFKYVDLFVLLNNGSVSRQKKTGRVTVFPTTSTYQVPRHTYR